MGFAFKIWNQGNDGRTMGIRVADVSEVARFASVCTEPDIAGNYANLQEYLDNADIATGTPPMPYRRTVNVVWLNTAGYNQHRYFPGRILEVTYNGRERSTGGYATQAYVIVDPVGYAVLAPHHKSPIQAQYVAHPSHDVVVVMP